MPVNCLYTQMVFTEDQLVSHTDSIVQFQAWYQEAAPLPHILKNNQVIIMKVKQSLLLADYITVYILCSYTIAKFSVFRDICLSSSVKEVQTSDNANSCAKSFYSRKKKNLQVYTNIKI